MRKGKEERRERREGEGRERREGGKEKEGKKDGQTMNGINSESMRSVKIMGTNTISHILPNDRMIGRIGVKLISKSRSKLINRER